MVVLGTGYMENIIFSLLYSERSMDKLMSHAQWDLKVIIIKVSVLVDLATPVVTDGNFKCGLILPKSQNLEPENTP